MKPGIVILLLTTLLGITRGVGQAPRREGISANGTFIQHSLVKTWGDSTWYEELTRLKDVGFDYLVIGPMMETSSTGRISSFYQSGVQDALSQTDILDVCLRNAERAGFKVFIGLCFSEKWWRDFDEEWLLSEVEKEKQVAADIVQKYAQRYPKALYGWYWFWEVDNVRFNTEARKSALAKAIDESRSFLQSISPGKPFMLCPFMNSKYGTASAYKEFWEDLFARIRFEEGDIFAPQDCVGAGGLKAEEVALWFGELAKAVKSKKGLLFWADVETFDQRFWTSVPIGQFLDRIEAVKPFVSNILTFAYSHYYSPVAVSDGFHKAYLSYVKTGKLPSDQRLENIPELVANYNPDDKVLNFRWASRLPTRKVAGYRVFTKAGQIADVQKRNLEKQLYSVALEASEFKGSIRVELYDFAGVVLATKRPVIE